VSEAAEILGEIEIEVLDEKGNILQRGVHPMHSLVANFARVLQGFASAPGGSPSSVTVRALDGSSQVAYMEWYAGYIDYSGGTPLAFNAGDNDDSYGIVVGSGARAVTIDDYNLESKIPHGTSPGQLDYDPTTVTMSVDTSVSPPVAYITISRVFKNLSGGNVTIREVALVARTYWKGGGQDLKYLIARDVLPTAYVVPPNASVNVKVTIKVVLG